MLCVYARALRCVLQFEGSSEAARCEQEFAHFISRYHLRRVRVRLLFTAAGLLLASIEPLASGNNTALLTLRCIVPIAVCLVAAGLCYHPAMRPFWRFHVVAASIIAYLHPTAHTPCP